MNVLPRFDQYQRHRPWLALPVAVVKKSATDRARDYAALIAFYGFLALFPLMLILVTAASVVLHSHPGLRQHVLSSALTHYPVIGPELQRTIRPLGQVGFALASGLVTMVFGCRRVALAMQHAINSAWAVPLALRPHGVRAVLRGFALLAVIGVCLLITSVLSGIAAILTVAASLLVNVAMFWAGFKLAAVRSLGWWQLLPGAAIAAIGWQVLEVAGGYLVTHQIARSSAVYGVFAIVLGLVTWLFLQAQLTMWAAEANVVLARRLWPRGLLPPATAADRRASELAAGVGKPA